MTLSGLDGSTIDLLSLSCLRRVWGLPGASYLSFTRSAPTSDFYQAMPRFRWIGTARICRSDSGGAFLPEPLSKSKIPEDGMLLTSPLRLIAFPWT